MIYKIIIAKLNTGVEKNHFTEYNFILLPPHSNTIKMEPKAYVPTNVYLITKISSFYIIQ